MRIFEKYAVKIGGGYNHRYNLSDSVLIKENHISAAGGIVAAVNIIRQNVSFVKKIEVEVETMEQIKEALEVGVDIIMLDNMDVATMKEAVELINERVLIEASGNVTLDNVLEVACSGVDYISIGALTHSYKVLDLSMKNLVNS
jgi:nicotinate-nucleotide pyrophosphorylase (carboxylating)